MDAPTEFTDRLHREFDGRLRIRWSASQHEWQIEQKIGHGRIPPIAIDEGRDDLIRARDGYHFVMSVRTGDRMRCPKCNYQLTVPVMDTWDIRCPYCRLKGRHTSVVAGYWPLNDRLLAHLHKIDPLNVFSEQQAAEADRYNERLLKQQEDDAMAPGYAEASDMYRRLVGIPMVGYSGKEFRGNAA